ncbi:MAG TPA: hypothetical protein PKO33_05760 [Pyrinomonadaceae bacterium]|nr:hypothetical protein [Pyrinomonadaceae bacterium]
MPTAVEISAEGVTSISQKLSEASLNLSPSSVGLLQIRGFDPSQLADLKGALVAFRNFLSPNARVEILSSAPIDAGVLASIGQQTQTDVTNRVSAAGGSHLNSATQLQSEIQSEAQKQQMERWKILQDTQTKIFEIQQDITVNRSKTSDKLHQKWDQFIRS